MQLLAEDLSVPQRSTPWRMAATEAEARGLRLLVDNLSPSQRKQYETNGYFEVIGGDTGTRYRIRRGYQMNIEELNEKGRIARLLCFMPEVRVPVGDVMLAQKFALELFESEAMRVAYPTPVWDDLWAWEMRSVWRRHG